MKDVFPIVPASSGPLWMFAGLAILLLALLGIFGWFAWSSRHAVVEVSGGGLRVAGVMYGRTVPLARLRLPEAAIVSAVSEDYRLAARLNGAGLPGFAAGWFRTNRGEKVLAFVTERRKVAYIPTMDGYALMLSVADPEALLEAARRAWTQSTR